MLRLPIAPDFAVELRSASDSLKTVQQKMQEYIDNGVRLGWLIDPQNQQVEIYRPGQDVEILRRRIARRRHRQLAYQERMY